MAPKSSSSLQDVIKRRQTSEFVGREEQFMLFRRNLHLPPDDDRRRFIFSVYGQGGVGKTTLVKQFQGTAQTFGAITAYVDEIAENEIEAMGLIAEQFRAQGHPLKAFEERYRVYRQRKQELEADPDVPPGISALVGQTFARAAMRLTKLTPASALTELIDEDAVSSQIGEWTSFVAHKLSNKDEVQLILRPVQILTPILLEAWRELAETRSIVLSLDTYERTVDFLDPWLRDMLEGRYGSMPINIVIVIAGRYELDKNLWSAFSAITTTMPLDPFSEEEARDYLSRKGIRNEQVVEMILRLSGRLPLLVAMLATQSPSDPQEVVDPSTSAVDRFLKWVDEPVRRRAALNAALPRELNKDILAAAIEGANTDESFEWLISMPFIEERAGRWHYHSVVRELMLRKKRQESPQAWSTMHDRLAKYFDKARADLGFTDEVGQSDSLWRELSLEILYHRLCQNPLKHRPFALDGFLITLETQRIVPALRWAQTIQQAGQDTSDAALTHWGETLMNGLKAYDEGHYSESEMAFTELLQFDGLSQRSRAVALNFRAAGYRMLTRYLEALNDLNQSIELLPDYAWALAQRGTVYRLLHRYEEALVDLNYSLDLDRDHPWALVNRGLVYAALEWFEDALMDMNHAIQLNPTYTWAIGQRGRVYRSMQRPEQALADFNQALALNPQLVWVWHNRAHLLGALGRYGEAMTDIKRALEIDPNNSQLIMLRGEMHRAIGHSALALTDFNLAVELAPTDAQSVAARGEYFLDLGMLAEAVADLTRAIELDPNNIRALSRRGHTYRRLGQQDKAMQDFDRAVFLGPKADWPRYERYLIYHANSQLEQAHEEVSAAIQIAQERYDSQPTNWNNTLNLLIYRLAAGDSSEAEALCRYTIDGGASPGRMRAAIYDIDDYLSFFPDDVQAAILKGLLQSARDKWIAGL